MSASDPFVVSEGNYLLSDREPWHLVREYLSEPWSVDTPREVRLSRLVERHIALGKEPAAAEAWALGPDETNARYVETTGRAPIGSSDGTDQVSSGPTCPPQQGWR